MLIGSQKLIRPNSSIDLQAPRLTISLRIATEDEVPLILEYNSKDISKHVKPTSLDTQNS